MTIMNTYKRGSKLKKIVSVIAFIIFFILVLLILLFGKKVRTLSSLEKVDDHPLYVMHYYGGYGFEDFLKKGAMTDEELTKTIKREIVISNNLKELDFSKYACSVFFAKNEKGEAISGRNLDDYDKPSLLLFTNAPGAYASVSTVDISILGYNKFKNNMPETSLLNRINLLAAPYIPLDGMNEYGLRVATLAVPHAEFSKDSEKKYIGYNQIMRLILDYAKNVDESISLIKKYNIYDSQIANKFGGGHIFVGDATGKSAIVEFIDGKIVVTENIEPWQVATNFIVNGVTHEDITDNRYLTAYDELKNKKGIISEEEAMKLLSDVSQRSTNWSEVFNSVTGDIQIVMGKNYDKVKNFKLKMKN